MNGSFGETRLAGWGCYSASINVSYLENWPRRNGVLPGQFRSVTDTFNFVMNGHKTTC
jgi:hypothetical protein